MANRRKRILSMRKVREILRLSLDCNLGNRDISRSCSVSHSTVGEYKSKVVELGLNYNTIQNMQDEELRKIFKKEKQKTTNRRLPEPDWSLIHGELKKKGVTLQLLWEEYKAVYSDGYQSTQFNHLYNQWKNKLNVSMRQIHKAGEKMFVDYAGHTVPIRDRHRGTEQQADIFVAVLGASNYTYAEATRDQTLPNWIMSHVRAFEYFGGVPRIVVPDNLRTGISKSCRYEPDINPAYQDMAAHYGMVVIPGRVGKPKDKAKVEVGVQIVSRWILARLRNRTFFSLRELNEAIREELAELNQRPLDRKSVV